MVVAGWLASQNVNSEVRNPPQRGDDRQEKSGKSSQNIVIDNDDKDGICTDQTVETPANSEVLLVEMFLSQPKHTCLTQQIYPGQMDQSSEAVPCFLALALFRGKR